MLFGATFLGSLLLTFYLYSFAFSATFQFDDYPNLDGLNQVVDAESGLAFILGGTSGPTGRPLALLTFLPQVASWPTSPQDFIYVNACIHLLNFLLVVWLSNRIMRVTAGFAGVIPANKWDWFSLACGVLWVSNPLLLSTSMMAVQRMTLLSSLVMLATMLIYLRIRESFCSDKAATTDIVRPLSVIACGLVLGVLFKETAINLLVYLALIEWILLAKRSDCVILRRFRVLILALPLLFLVAYIIGSWYRSLGQVTIREFTLYERFISAPRIIMDYLGQGLAPKISTLGLFHDDFQASQGWLSPPATLVSTVVLVSIIVFLWKIRGRYAIVTFGGFWFILGNVIEAGPIGLELYYEHRCYLPLFGIMLILSACPFLVPFRLRRPFFLIPIIFGVISFFNLSQATSLWGCPAVAAEVWYGAHPKSVRASQYFLQALLKAGYPEKAEMIAGQAIKRLPSSPSLGLQKLQIDCLLNYPSDAVITDLQHVTNSAPAGFFEYSALDSLRKLVFSYIEGECPAFSFDDLFLLIDLFLKNEKYRSSKPALARLHLLRADLYMHKRDFDSCMKEYEVAFEVDPNVETLAASTALFLDAGLPEEAVRHINAARGRLPSSYVINFEWKRKIVPIQVVANSKKADTVKFER